MVTTFTKRSKMPCVCLIKKRITANYMNTENLTPFTMWKRELAKAHKRNLEREQGIKRTQHFGSLNAQSE